MSDVDIREVDRADEAQLHAWWSAGHAAMSERPVDLWPDWEISRLSLPEVDPDNRIVLLGAYDGDAMVGSGLTVLPLKDNTHLGFLEVYVPPDHRRQGVGSALLDHAEQLVAADDRTTLLADVRVPLEDDNDDRRWAEDRGYAVANVDTVKVVDLAATADLLPDLEAQAAERLGDYRLAWWTDPAPEEHLASLAAAMSRFVEEIPLGDLDLQPQAWTPERLRVREARRAAHAPRAAHRGRARSVGRGGRLHQRDPLPARAAGRRHRRHAGAAGPSRPPPRAWPSRCCCTSRSGRCTLVPS